MKAGRLRGGARYERGSEEFARVVNFSDALFAIALTLLIVTIEVPTEDVSGADLSAEVRRLWPQVFSYLLSFAVIGYYWLAHHRLVAQLRVVDTAFVVLNLFYLACIAFFPFPTALLGEHGPRTLSVGLYAACGALVSGVETGLFVVAHRSRLFFRDMPAEVFRYGLVASLLPVATFLLSIPVAVWQPAWAMAVWALTIPAERILDRTAPAAVALWEQ